MNEIIVITDGKRNSYLYKIGKDKTIRYLFLFDNSGKKMLFEIEDSEKLSRLFNLCKDKKIPIKVCPGATLVVGKYKSNWFRRITDFLKRRLGHL